MRIFNQKYQQQAYIKEMIDKEYELKKQEERDYYEQMEEDYYKHLEQQETEL